MARMVHRHTQTPSPTLEMRASFASASCVFRDESVMRSESHEPSKAAQTQRERKNLLMSLMMNDDVMILLKRVSNNKC